MGGEVKQSRISGSVEKSELYRTLALAAADALDGAAADDEAAGERLRVVAREARELAEQFASWPANDPGPEGRIRATARLMDLRSMADEVSRRR